MKPFFSEKLKNLNLSSPLYAVGGCVRNALLGLAESADTDLAGDLSVNEMKAAVLSPQSLRKGTACWISL